ncbi:MAG: MarR family winged helix-turn-helix transcriptional regulator [Polaromonas sp.]|nr:MarR family winged helix-turn-helix transcriptional regulator [Polaromonas sp.]
MTNGYIQIHFQIDCRQAATWSHLWQRAPNDRVKPMRLTDLMALGDIAASLLGEVRRSLGMNQTEIQICWVLGDRDGAKVRPGPPMTLGEMADALCIPGSRIANRLPNLVRRGLVSPVARTEGGVSMDGRLRFYRLTRSGCTQVDKLMKEISRIDNALHWITSQKTDDAITEYVQHLRCGLKGRAFGGLDELKAAMLDGTLATRRKHPLPLWKLLDLPSLPGQH